MTSLKSSSSSRASKLLVAALIVASLGMLIVNQRVRSDSLLIDRVDVSGDFAPDGDGVDDVAAISFRVKDDDKVDVDIVDSDGDEVRNLADAQPVETDDEIELSWNGFDDGGKQAEPGVYSLRINLRDRDREITPGEQISLEEEED
jgi:flagellar hook assembly protein FlgD